MQFGGGIVDLQRHGRLLWDVLQEGMMGLSMETGLGVPNGSRAKGANNGDGTWTWQHQRVSEKKALQADFKSVGLDLGWQ
jgi:hypothetical protein